MTNPLLTLDNIRSGAAPSDAVAVGYLLGEIERLQRSVAALTEDNRIGCHAIVEVAELHAELERAQHQITLLLGGERAAHEPSVQQQCAHEIRHVLDTYPSATFCAKCGERLPEKSGAGE